MYYGAQGDGVTDDSNAFQLAVNAATANGSGAGGLGAYVLMGCYKFKIGASLTVPANVTFLSLGATLSGVGASTVSPIINYGAPGTPQLTGPLDLAVRSVTTLASGPYTPTAGVLAAINNIYYAPIPSGGDDTTALQNLINLANSGSTGSSNANNALPTPGGCVFLQSGTYLVQNLVLPTGVWLIGAGQDATIIKLINSATVTNPILQTKNFATLKGTNPASGDLGPFGFAIFNLTFDGNKANNGSNTATAAVCLYGYDWTWQNVRVRNSNTVGWWSEWTNAASAPALGDAMEARCYNVKAHDAVSHGIVWNGPHDSDLHAVNAYNNGARGFWTQANGNNTKFNNCHSWGLTQTYPWYLEGTATILTACEGEGGSAAQGFVGANDCQIEGGVFFAAGGATTGWVIGDGTHTLITGTDMKTKILNCITAPISFAQDSGGTYIVTMFGASGPAYTGTPNAASTVLIVIAGGMTHPGNFIGSATFTKAGFTVGGALNAQFALIQTRIIITYSASMAINAAVGTFFDITATDGNAFTVNTPTNPVDGQQITFTIRNISGGALGAVTWGAGYKLATWTSPATANSRSITFRYSSTVSLWVEVTRTTVDVPN